MKLKLFDLLSGYEKIAKPSQKQNKKAKSRRFFKRKISGGLSVKDGAHLSHFSTFSNKLLNITYYTASRAYGAFLLAFSVITIFLNSGADFIFISLPLNKTSLIIGIAAALISLPFFFLEGPIGSAIERRKPLSELVYEFFCIKRPLKSDVEKGLPLIFCLSLGIIAAFIGFFTSTYIVALVMIGIVFAYLSFISPEFSLFGCILLLPSISALGIHDYVACFAAVIMLLSYLRKVIYGKRNYNFEQYDILIILMIISVLISGIFVGGMESFKMAAVIIASTSVYCTTGNLITNPRLLDCMTKAIIFSSVIPCLTAVFQFAFLWLRVGFVGAALRGVSATFASSASFACFLTVTVCFAFMYARQKRSFLYSLIFVLNCAAMLMSANPFAPITIILACIMYAFLKLRRAAIIPVLLIAALPYLAVLFPEMSWLSLIVGDDVGSIVELWSRSFALIRDNLLFGVGLSSDVFKAAVGMDSPDASNLFIDISVKSGVLTLAFFLLLLIVRLMHRISYQRFLKESDTGMASATSCITVMAFIIFGTFNQMFTDMSLYYIFFSAFAIGSATLRIACEEHDDRVAYFADVGESDSAAVDIDLHGFMQN